MSPTRDSDSKLCVSEAEEKASQRWSFEFSLGRQIRKHFRRWHIALALTILGFVGFRYGIGYSIGLLVLGTVLLLGVAYISWRSKFDGVVQVRSSSPKEERTSKLFKWAGFLVAASIFAFGKNQQFPHKTIPVENTSHSQIVTGSLSQSDSQTSVQRRDANQNYWRSAVGNLHVIRFQAPAGQEPAEQYFDRMILQLKKLTQAARALPTTNVDADLVQMAKRHLELEDSILQFKQRLDDEMKNEKLPRPTDTLDQRMTMVQLIFRMVQLNPDVLKNMEPGPVRDLIEQAVVLEQQRQKQWQEIEIMQAVLQERYKGTSFPLPNVN